MDHQLEVMEMPVLLQHQERFNRKLEHNTGGITLNDLTDQIVAIVPPVYTSDLEYYKFQFKNNSPSDPDF